jgi:hypothetical protein
LPQAMRAGWYPFSVLPVSLSPSPPFSVSQQAGPGLIKIFALSVQNKFYNQLLFYGNGCLAVRPDDTSSNFNRG